MPETFLILLAGGVMLAAALSDPKEVTLHWLRLGGMIALCMAGLALFFYFRRGPLAELPIMYRRIQLGLVLATVGAILGQLAFVQVAWRTTQRVLATGAFLLAV